MLPNLSARPPAARRHRPWVISSCTYAPNSLRSCAAGVSVKIRRKARNEWLTLKPNTHEGYVSWEKFEAIRTMVSSNVPTSRHHGAPKHGDALLAGLIRCKRCGRKLTLRYSGMENHIPRYSCSRAWMDNGGPHCIAFGGLRVDDAIEEAQLCGVVNLLFAPVR